MKMTGGEALVASLQVHGVEVVFGFPGNHTIPIYEALRRQDAIRHVLVRHEQGAAFMADGYARSSGRVGAPMPPDVPDAAAADVARAADILLSANMPLVLAGGGLVSAGASAELRELAERLGAPVVTTCMGKGALPDDHPLAVGVSQSQSAREYFELADVVLAVGCRFRQVSTRGWSLPINTLIHIDADPTAFDRNYTPQLAIPADARSALSALLERIPPGHDADDWGWAEHLPAVPPTPQGRDALHARIADELRAALAPDAILCLDVCIPAYRLMPRFAVTAPRSVLYPAAYIAMGYGLPAAIGAKMAHPDRQVACVAGDGGFLMTGVELATAVSQDLAIPIIVFNDSCLQSVKGTHERAYNGHSFGVELQNPDFVAFAAAFGVDGCRVTEPDDIRQSIHRAVNHHGSFLVEIVPPAEL